MTKRALITGITGQDGAYLSRILLEQGYEVFGMVRSSKTKWSEGLEEIHDRIHFIEADLMDFPSLRYALAKSQPNEIYNLGAQSVVTRSWVEPLLTIETTGMGPIRLLEAIRLETPEAKFFQPSSSEMFGISDSLSDPLSAEYYPLSPYAAAKLLGYHITRLYRERYGIFALSAVLFNHESPFRDPIFVSRKISMAVARISLGKQKILKMGNLDVIRDWGFAGDFMHAVWKMMQQPKPDDFVVATGEGHSVREMLQIAFDTVGLNYEKYVEIDSDLIRPLDSSRVVGNPSKAIEALQWKPTVPFKEVIQTMVHSDMDRMRAGKVS